MRRNSPQFAGVVSRIEARLARLEAMLGVVDAAGRDQRFAGGQVGLDRIGGRHTGACAKLIGHGDGLVVGAAAGSRA